MRAVDEGAPTKRRFGGRFGEEIEDREDPFARAVVLGNPLRDSRLSPLRAALEVSAYERILAAERRVERRLRDSGSLDDPLDPDGVNALLVEELVGSRQESVSRRSLAFHGRHALTIQTGLFTVKSTRQTCLFTVWTSTSGQGERSRSSA
ncbi:MAG: hypothetical protein K0S65_3721, partial [Labilithrix sp.]|nr:hypothetical protein [Labilithrix sp.]